LYSARLRSRLLLVILVSEREPIYAREKYLIRIFCLPRPICSKDKPLAARSLFPLAALRNSNL
jgi:hypothetical protein